jgi:hypothetical protein
MKLSLKFLKGQTMSSFILIFLPLLLALPVRAAQDPIFISFWEENGIRKVFEYQNQEWKSSLREIKNQSDLKAMPLQYSAPNKWTLFYDGKTYNELTTIPFETYSSYSENGLQRLNAKAPDLPFRKFDKRFTDWSGKNLRPILASNQKDLKGPDGWKVQKVSALAPFVLNDLKKRLKGVITYYSSNECATQLKRELSDSEIVTSISYKASNGSDLLSYTLKFPPKTFTTCNVECDMCSDRGSFWYSKTANGEFAYLTEARSLIEAADLNKDGHSELLFWIPGYNSDGYRLIDGQSKNITDATWSYH